MTDTSLITDGAAPAAPATDATPVADTNATAAAADATNPDAASASTDANKPAEGDAKPAEGDAKPDDSTKDDDAAKAPEKVVPEKYEDFTLPEGVAPNPETITQFTTLAKELELSQEQAQKLADIGAGIVKSNTEAQANVLREAVNGWREQSATDKEFGGDKFTENLAVAKTALDTFGTPELKDLLVKSGLGNHPEILRAFYRAGKSISEDKVIPGGFGSTSTKSPADRLYGSPS